MRGVRGNVATTSLFTFLLTSDAYAYIDPGSGSVVTTAIIGFFAAVAFTVRKYFYKLTGMFSKPRDQSKSSDD